MRLRLQELMSKEEILPSKLAEILDVQPSAISHIINGRNNPGYDFIAKLATKFPHINTRWLLLGEGEIYTKPQPPTTQQLPPNKQKNIERIIVFYTDKSFETYEK